MLRVLLIAEAANPEWVSVPLVGWSLAAALSKHSNVHLVTQVRNREAILKAGLVEGRDFTAIDSERFAAPLYRLSELLRGGKGVGWTTVSAATTLSYYYFERLLWRRFGSAIRRGEFDVVHRITPLSPTTPSLIAKRCGRANIPFILGPLNGGVPWPREFQSARRKEREWLSYARSAYKLLPGYRSTLRHSAAIIAGSHSTLNEIPARFREKCIYLPENAIDPARFGESRAASPGTPLRGCFVGRLVPYKGPDMLIEAVAPLLRSKRLQLDVIGDGPLMPALRELVEREGVRESVRLHGWITHERLQAAMCESQMLLFPSIREFGGGVVLEAMALGIVPVVVDYAGPGELVTDAVGYRVPLGDRQALIGRLRSLVAALCDDPQQLVPRSAAARAQVRELFTWDVKARQVLQVYEWARESGERPNFFLKSVSSRA